MNDDTPTYIIEAISVTAGARRGSVYLPGRIRHAHGLGLVGEPLLPYLGRRAEGYDIALPDDLRDLRAFYIDWAAEPLPSGRQPIVHVPLTDIDAPDVAGLHREEAL